MAIWNGRPNTSAVLRAAEQWKKNCLLNDGGLLSAEELWTAANVTELTAAFLNNPIHGSEKFIDKLERQLSGNTPVIQQLGAETLWLLYLFVSDNQMGPVAKRKRIAQIWPASAGDLPDSPLLSDETLAGVASPGAAFMMKMPDEAWLSALGHSGFQAASKGAARGPPVCPMAVWRMARAAIRR